MHAAKDIEDIRDRFVSRSLAPEDLLLHLEPALMQLALDAQAQAEVRRIVNSIERLVFTETDPRRLALLTDQLDVALAWVRARMTPARSDRG